MSALNQICIKIKKFNYLVALKVITTKYKQLLLLSNKLTKNM